MGVKDTAFLANPRQGHWHKMRDREARGSQGLKLDPAIGKRFIGSEPNLTRTDSSETEAHSHAPYQDP